MMKLKKRETKTEESIGPGITIDTYGNITLLKSTKGCLCLKTGDSVEIIQENDKTILRKK